MSQSNVDLVRSLYPDGGLRLTNLVADDAAVDETRRVMAPHLAPGFEWVGNRDAIGTPDPRGGFDAFVENYGEMSLMFEEAVLVPVEVTGHGDHVLVIARLTGRLVRSDAPYETLGAAVYTFEDGKIKRIEEFSDLDRARAAAGAA